MQIANLITASLWLLLAAAQVIETRASFEIDEEDKSSRRAQRMVSSHLEGDQMGQQPKVDLVRRRVHETKQLVRARDNYSAATSGDDELGVQFIQVDSSVQSNLRQQQLKEQQQQQNQNLQKPSQKLAPGSSLSLSHGWHKLGASQSTSASDKQVANLESLNKFLLDQQDRNQEVAAAAHDDESHHETLEDQPSGATYARQLQPPKQKPKAMKQLSSTPILQFGPSPMSSTTASPQVDHLTRLYLDSRTPQEVRAHLGETAYLLCRLRANLQQSEQLQVSWVRPDRQILTSGEFRYTSDERFRPSHPGGGSNDWLLEIHNVRASDEGDYECQVNSEPKPASVTVHLQVIATQVEILEAPTVRVDEDAQIELTCRVQFNSQAELAAAAVAVSHRALVDAEIGQSQDQMDEVNGGDTLNGPGSEREFELANKAKELEEEAKVIGMRQKRRRLRSPLVALRANNSATRQQPFWPYWYKDNVSLEYNNPRGNIQVQKRDLTSGGIESVLRLNGARRADNGTYVCKLVPALNEVQPAQAQVLVVPSGAPSCVRQLNEQLLVCQLLIVSSLVIQINRLLV